jgi:drug/metabolite transporter (DMT)-like permease
MTMHSPASASSALPSRSATFATLAAFAGIYIIWGTTYLAIALAIKTIPPFISGGVRFLLAGGLMYAWLRWRDPQPFAGVDLRVAALCGVLLSGIGNGFVIWAQQGIPTGIAALIVCAVPVLVLVFDWAFFSRRKPSTQALVGTAVAVAGVATIVMHTRTLSGAAQPLYIVSILAATVGWSFGTLLQKRSARAETVLSFTCVQMLSGGLFQFCMAGLTGEYATFDASAISLASVLGVLYLIVFGSVIALNCYLWLLTRVSASKVTTYALVNPVVALLLGALFLGESVTPLAIAAAVLVLVGVALVLFQNIGFPKLGFSKLVGSRLGRECDDRSPCRSSAKSEST